MRKTLLVVFVLSVIVINGCVNKPIGDRKGITPDSCNTDSDCVIKDVHSCCGYFPRCVNKDYIPDIESVRRGCQKKGLASICGFSEITNCKCVENTCMSMQGDSVV